MDNPEYNSFNQEEHLKVGEEDLPSQEETNNYLNQNKDTQNYYSPPSIEIDSPPTPSNDICPPQNTPQEEIQKTTLISIPIPYNINEPIFKNELNPTYDVVNPPIINTTTTIPTIPEILPIRPTIVASLF